MKANEFYNRILYLSYSCDCTSISSRAWDLLMAGAVQADKRRVKSLIKKHLPALYKSLSLELYNPYKCYRTAKHLIYVHSGIEYFLRIYNK